MDRGSQGLDLLCETSKKLWKKGWKRPSLLNDFLTVFPSENVSKNRSKTHQKLMKKPLEKSMRSVMDFFIDFELRNRSKMAPKPFQKPSRTDIKNGRKNGQKTRGQKSTDPPGTGPLWARKKKTGAHPESVPPQPPRYRRERLVASKQTLRSWLKSSASRNPPRPLASGRVDPEPQSYLAILRLLRFLVFLREPPPA